MQENNKKISCIVLTCDSHIHKSFSVLHCLCSIFNQDYPNVEVILVENSFNKNKKYFNTMGEAIKKWNLKRNFKYEFNLITNQKSLDMGSARNVGAKVAKGEILVFVDDDTIIINKNALSQVAKYSTKYECGYGAKRFWTADRLFNKKSNEILSDLENGKTEHLEKIAHFPSPMLREGNQSKLILSNTFITNFGFCLKTKFFEVGPFPDYKGYGFHDDYLMYKLFKTKSKLILLKNIKVIHVNHEIYPHPNKNIIDYFDDLVRDGYYWFNSEKMFMNKQIPREKILQKIGTLHYDPILDEAYEYYQKINPLNINKKNDELNIWKNINRFSREEFARQIYLIKESSNLDEYVKKSEADFDNLASSVLVAIDYKFIKLNKNGKITNLHRPNLSLKLNKPIEETNLRAKSILNQFPCDKDSIKRRISFLRSRYPFAEYMKMAIIGDDDLLSIYAVNEIWLRPIIIEKDNAIIDKINNISSRFEIIHSDIRDLLNNDKFHNNNRIHTFITDPPYTTDGMLLFTLIGLKLLKIQPEGNEFYVVINKTMIGKNLFKILNILADSNVYLVSVLENFSTYKLPSHFSERKRASKFLQSINLRKTALEYSSSSNLYIFWTKEPDIRKIQENLRSKLIYEHYR